MAAAARPPSRCVPGRRPCRLPALSAAFSGRQGHLSLQALRYGHTDRFPTSSSLPYLCSCSAILSSCPGIGWRRRSFLFHPGGFRRRPRGPTAGETWRPISILVPCYNEGGQRRRDARHGVRQPSTTLEFEIIAINDGSRDNTAEVLNRLPTAFPICASSTSPPTRQGHRAQYRRTACQARIAGLHRRRRAARSTGAVLGCPRLPPRDRWWPRWQSAHP